MFPSITGHIWELIGCVTIDTLQEIWIHTAYLRTDLGNKHMFSVNYIFTINIETNKLKWQDPKMWYFILGNY